MEKRRLPGSIDDYLADLPAEQRAALQQLRQTIQAAAPEATEAIAYGVPAFKQNGNLVSFGAGKNHCALYCMSPAVMEAHAADLEGYYTTKGGIRFKPDKPLPAELVTKLVRARIAENERAASTKKR